MKRIACISQKGGVGKSTLARDIAVQFAANDWSVRIADLDARQSTSIVWGEKRQEAGLAPEVAVAGFGSVTDAIKANGVDLSVYDGKPYSDADTRKLAEVADLIVIPTGATLDDLFPQTLLAHELGKHRVAKDRILFVLNSVSSPLDGQEVVAAKLYLTEAGYRVADSVIPRRTAYGQAQNTGRSLSEVTHHSLRDHAVNLVKEIGEILLEEKS
jgi:chromosome partitioning protein